MVDFNMIQGTQITSTLKSMTLCQVLAELGMSDWDYDDLILWEKEVTATHPEVLFYSRPDCSYSEVEAEILAAAGGYRILITDNLS
jgi:hypothetical protein